MTARALLMACTALLAGSGVLQAAQAAQVPLEPDTPASLLSRVDEAIAAADAAGTGAVDNNDAAGLAQPLTNPAAENRACDGCPPRSVGRALFQSTIINAAYGMVNLVRGHDSAKITPKSWWHNMEQGWVWDLNDFSVNQVGHPYQGNNYYTSGRANGLSFYESGAIAAFGSATWEYFGETNPASLNDFINTTLGGIALGEMFHRTAWLIRDTRASGRGRLWSEIAATAVDPIGGYNRFRTGDASRVHDKPADLVPSGLGSMAALGVLWRGQENGSVSGAEGQPFLEMDLLYGDTRGGHSRTPYEAFAVKLRFGGGNAFSEARVRGRLVGQPLSDGKVNFAVLQSYDYQHNDAYATGSQSFDAALGIRQPLTPRVGLWVLGWGGLTVLGAVDSLPLDVSGIPDEGGDGGSESANSGPRYYDYGPGSNFGVFAEFARDNRPFAVLFYEGRQMYSLDGVRANHFLQRARLDLLLPVRNQLGFGASAEYFDRHTFYQDETNSERRFHYPQLRAYLTWTFN